MSLAVYARSVVGGACLVGGCVGTVSWSTPTDRTHPGATEETDTTVETDSDLDSDSLDSACPNDGDPKVVPLDCAARPCPTLAAAACAACSSTDPAMIDFRGVCETPLGVRYVFVEHSRPYDAVTDYFDVGGVLVATVAASEFGEVILAHCRDTGEPSHATPFLPGGETSCVITCRELAPCEDIAFDSGPPPSGSCNLRQVAPGAGVEPCAGGVDSGILTFQ